MAKKIRIGIAGTGMMAQSHAASFGRISDVEIVACCDVDLAKAQAFAETFGISRAYSDYGDMLSHDGLDAVSIVTPDAVHPEMAIMAARSGKHVLCEKPLAVSGHLASKMADEAERAGVVGMVNLSYRKSAALQAARRLIASGQLGQIRHVRAHYLQSWLVSDAWGDWKTGEQWLWRLSKSHGSLGVLGDVGVHLLDFATYPVGGLQDIQCSLATFQKNEENRVGPYVLDANDSASMTCTFKNGAMGVFQVSRWATGHLNSIELVVHGDEGALSIDLDASYTSLKLCNRNEVHKAKWKTRTYRETPSIYQSFVKAIRRGEASEPTFRRGAEVQSMLDACFQAAESGQRVSVL